MSSEEKGFWAMPMPILCICIGVPLLLIAALDLIYFELGVGEEFTGYLRRDLMYYSANARELFENGNGLFYGDPFSASFTTPRVFSHLQLLLLGWAWKLTGLPLPILWQAGQVLGGVVMFAGLYRLLCCFFDREQRDYAFLVAALGGGGTALSALSQWGTSADGGTFLQHFDQMVSGPSGPGWLPNVFQNAAFTTEAFYHALAFATFAAVLRGRLAWAALGVFCTWWAHPFTGLEVAAIVGAFALMESVLGRDRRMIVFATSVAAISTVFLAYYVWLLPTWSPEAADILMRWRRSALIFEFSEAFAMWGVFLAGIVFLAYPSWRLLDLPRNPRDRFVGIWMVIVAALLLHDRLLPSEILPYQPIHFSHGYFFLPLAILTLRGMTSLSEAWSINSRRAGAVAFLLLVMVDNVCFTINVATSTHRPVLSADLVAVVELLEVKEPALVLLGKEVPLAEYLSVRTPHRVYNFSRLQTPWFEDKLTAMNRAMTYPSPATAAAGLGIRWVVGERRFRREFDDDIASGRARLAKDGGRYQVVEILVPAVPQRPEKATHLPPLSAGRARRNR